MTGKVERIQTVARHCECAFGPDWDRQSAAVDNPAGHNLAAECTDLEDSLAAYSLAESPGVPSNIAGSGTTG